MQPNPRKTKSVRELGAVDVTVLREAVLSIPEAVWELENAGKPNKFEALDRTSHIVFRFVKDFDDWRTSYDFPVWNDFKALVEPVMMQAVAPYGYRQGEYPRVMLARMAPGGIIAPHVDANPSARWPHKIHVPLQTNARVEFFVQPNIYNLKEGCAYEVNNMGYHAVRNGGETNRIHLIFEYFDLEQPVASVA